MLHMKNIFKILNQFLEPSQGDHSENKEPSKYTRKSKGEILSHWRKLAFESAVRRTSQKEIIGQLQIEMSDMKLNTCTLLDQKLTSWLTRKKAMKKS